MKVLAPKNQQHSRQLSQTTHPYRAGTMGATTRYFREQFRVNKLTLEHDSASDFYLSCWQTGRSPVPLLCLRLFLFLGCVAILIASLVLSVEMFNLKYWPIFMTHWGVVMITVASGLAFLVSAMATVNGSIGDSENLPWYAKLYWLSMSVTVPVAIFITIFYYALLTGLDIDFAVNNVLDFFIHGMNSLVMLCLLLTARHPVHVLHFLYPFLFAIIYMLFSIIYYFAGGTGPQGESWIYPMLDWAEPGTASVVVVGSAAFLLIAHILVIGLAALRDWFTRKYIQKLHVVNFA